MTEKHTFFGNENKICKNFNFLKNFQKSVKKRLTREKVCGNIYKLSAREQRKKHEIKNFEKSLKKCEKMLDKEEGLVVIYTSFPRKSGKPELLVRKTQIKNGIRKK